VSGAPLRVSNAASGAPATALMGAIQILKSAEWDVPSSPHIAIQLGLHPSCEVSKRPEQAACVMHRDGNPRSSASVKDNSLQ
jgi:hypothetical protein